MTVTYDLSNTPLVLDSTTESITQQGDRVISATLNDGTQLIVDGQPVAGPTVDITLPFFNAVGGDQYFFYVSGGTATYLSQVYTPVPLSGNTDQQALEDYITGLSTNTGNEIDLTSNFSGAYDSTKDGRIVTISDLDDDGIQDPIETLLGRDFPVASTDDQILGGNPAALQNAVNTANTAAVAQATTDGQNAVITDPISFYDDIVAAAPGLTTIIRGDTTIGTVTPPTSTVDGMAPISFSLFELANPGDAGTEIPGTETNFNVVLPAGTQKLFFEADAK